jgi:membrane protein
MADRKGHQASSPWHMPLPAWKDVLLRAWKEQSEDNISLAAAGVAFYGFLALVPLLGAIVLIYGIAADPQTVLSNVKSLTSVLPAEVAKLIGQQLMSVVQTSGGKKGLGLLIAIAVALWGARNAATSIMTALNIAYEERETRGTIRVNLLALAITGGGVIMAVLALLAITALGFLQRLLPHTPGALVVFGKVLSYVLLLLGAAAGAATLYRYAPCRAEAKWQWITPGSLFAAISWLILTLAFGFYVAHFGNYNKTYGSLATVVILVTWLYLSAYLFLLGAEVNSEFEKQTAKPTTEGSGKPTRDRKGWSAD